MFQSAPGYAICVACTLLVQAAALADLKKDAPKDVCAYLEKESLKPGDYKELSKGHWFASAVKVVGPEGSPNNLNYNVDGESSSKVTKVFLNLDIDDPSTAKPGHDAFLSASELLIEKATGSKPTDAIRKALRGGTDGKFKLGGVAVEVAKIKKGGGPKYVLQLLIKR